MPILRCCEVTKVVSYLAMVGTTPLYFVLLWCAMKRLIQTDVSVISYEDVEKCIYLLFVNNTKTNTHVNT